METVLLVAIALVALAAVALPLLREPRADDRLDHLTDAQRDRLRLREERDAALSALRELEFDHRTGKIADEDYRALVVDYRRRVGEALVALGEDAEPAAAARAGTVPEGGAEEVAEPTITDDATRRA